MTPRVFPCCIYYDRSMRRYRWGGCRISGSRSPTSTIILVSPCNHADLSRILHCNITPCSRNAIVYQTLLHRGKELCYNIIIAFVLCGLCWCSMFLSSAYLRLNISSFCHGVFGLVGYMLQMFRVWPCAKVHSYLVIPPLS